jgi:hypothetical protein
MSKYGRITQSEIEIIAERTFTEGVTYALYYAEGGLDRAKAVADAADIVRDELEKAGVLTQPKRSAIVEVDRGRTVAQVQHYLPGNFEARDFADVTLGDVILIEGYDRAGWTLDEYVIPRLASGLIVAKEVK